MEWRSLLVRRGIGAACSEHLSNRSLEAPRPLQVVDHDRLGRVVRSCIALSRQTNSAVACVLINFEEGVSLERTISRRIIAQTARGLRTQIPRWHALRVERKRAVGKSQRTLTQRRW